MPALKHPKLSTILLEEAMPHCVIEGADYTDATAGWDELRPSDDGIPTFLKRYEECALQRDLEEESVVKRDKLQAYVGYEDVGKTPSAVPKQNKHEPFF